jgi:hypothetical protein
MRGRPWPWLRDQIIGLLAKPPVWDFGAPRFTTRIQAEVWPSSDSTDQERGRA